MGAATALRRLVGGLLLSIGILMTLCCGLCTGYFGFISIAELFHKGGGSDIWPFILVGAVATLIGVALAWLGLRMVRT